MAYTPPAAHHAARLGIHAGDSAMAKPPYPVSTSGVSDDGVTSERWATNIGMLVPSSEG